MLLCARAALHQDGALQHLLHQLLEVGQRSARLLALAALHMAGLFVQCPPLALLYLPVIQQLLISDVRDASSQVLRPPHAPAQHPCQLVVLPRCYLTSFSFPYHQGQDELILNRDKSPPPPSNTHSCCPGPSSFVIHRSL